MESTVQEIISPSSSVTTRLARWSRTVLSNTLKDRDAVNWLRHLYHHFARAHYPLHPNGIANAKLGLYLARNHYVKARLESCEVCKAGLLLIIK